MLQKAHMHSTPSFRSLSGVATETVPVLVWLMMTFSILSRKIVKCFLFLCLSAPGDQWCDVLVFVPAESQVPQHFRSSQMHDIWCLLSSHTNLSPWSFPDSSMSRTVYPQKSLKADVDLHQFRQTYNHIDCHSGPYTYHWPLCCLSWPFNAGILFSSKFDIKSGGHLRQNLS